MDHIPLPQASAIEFDVPLWTHRAYEGGDFETYPTRTGWKLKLVDIPRAFYRNDLQVTNDAEVAAFLQSWLYFGLLCEVTEQVIDPTWFERLTESGDSRLSSIRLESIITRWACDLIEHFLDVEDADVDKWERELTAWTERKLGTLNVARNVWLRLVWDDDDVDFGPIGIIDQVCLTIALLGEYLSRAVHQIAEAAGAEPEHTVPWPVASTRIKRLFLDPTRLGQWCPNKIHGVLKAASCTAGLTWYLLNLQPPRTSDNHSSCSPDRCHSLNVDLETYMTRHTSPNCGCASTRVESDVLGAIVTRGSIALVTYDNDETSGKLTMTEQQDEHPYVAISHVWAHGLGNRVENALPSCALRQLQSSVNAIGVASDKRVPFWIDSLCLPRNPLSLRRKAVLRLSEVFADATDVLVWDSYLQQYDSSSMIEIEIIARILMSDWTTRLWTFSEGKLAKKIWFQFRDKAVDFRTMELEWLERFSPRHMSDVCPVSPLSSIEWQLMLLYDATVGEARYDDVPDQHELNMIRSALGTRQTSWSGDEALCLGAMFRFDLKDIVEAEDGGKMAVFWQMMKSIPPAIIFAQFSPKLETLGSRWAPATLMDGANTDIWTQGHWGLETESYARPTESGLLGRFIASLPAYSMSGDRMGDNLGRDFLVNRFVHGEGEESTYLLDSDGKWFRCRSVGNWHQTPRPQECGRCLPGIVFDLLPPPEGSDTANALKSSGKGDIEGVLVTFEHTELGGRSSHHPLPVRGYKSLIINWIAPKKGTFLDEIVDIANSFCQEAASRIETSNEAASAPETLGIYDELLDWVQIVGLEERLLVSAAEIFDNWDVDDDALTFQYLRLIHFFAHVKQWYRWTKTAEMELCID